ncbi:MAG: DUF2298 domain-containing protein [Pyrinomonadaceae bacterium]
MLQTRQKQLSPREFALRHYEEHKPNGYASSGSYSRMNPPAPLHTNPFVRAGLITIAISAIAVVCALPFLMDLHSDAQGPELLDQPGSPTGAWLLLWAPIAGAWVLALVTEARNRLALDSSEAVLMKRFVIIPIALWLVAKIVTGNDHFVLIFLAATTVWTAREAFFVQREDQVYTWLCRIALCGLLALVWSGNHLGGFPRPPYHRQDTAFKFGLQAWYLLGIAAACAALRSTPTATTEEPESPDVMAWRFCRARHSWLWRQCSPCVLWRLSQRR